MLLVRLPLLHLHGDGDLPVAAADADHAVAPAARGASVELPPLVGGMLVWFLLLPMMSRARWRVEVIRVQMLYSFAHAVAVADTLKGITAAWVPTGAVRTPSPLVGRVRRLLLSWLLLVQVTQWLGAPAGWPSSASASTGRRSLFSGPGLHRLAAVVLAWPRRERRSGVTAIRFKPTPVRWSRRRPSRDRMTDVRVTTARARPAHGVVRPEGACRRFVALAPPVGPARVFTQRNASTWACPVTVVGGVPSARPGGLHQPSSPLPDAVAARVDDEGLGHRGRHSAPVGDLLGRSRGSWRR